ncbi:hypothetical protein [Deinococcus sp. Marseille-Q6407]|uniref:hypothetical protein n=1 Tax=Deinococcus sp. Marseille-Q6407 TaxID=2969223 RepID=UPI0021C17944|nr:hypothetical protein [Deinococcus sp. Marseille-Q6407]
MIRKANNLSSPNPQGGAASRAAGLYQTGHGFLSGARPRVLWDGGAQNDPDPASTGTQEGQSQQQSSGGQNSQSTSTGQQQNTQAQQQQGQSGMERLADALRGLVNQPRHGGDPFAAALTLMGENHGYRDRIRELEGTTNQQAEQLTAYRALGEDPAALAERLRRGDEAVYLQEVTDLAGRVNANPRVLARELQSHGLTAYVRDMPAGGGHPARQEVHVRNQTGEELGELRAYAEAHLGDYMSALFPQGGQSSATTRTVPVVAQRGASNTTAPGTNFVQERLEQRRKAAAGETA